MSAEYPQPVIGSVLVRIAQGWVVEDRNDEIADGISKVEDSSGQMDVLRSCLSQNVGA